MEDFKEHDAASTRENESFTTLIKGSIGLSANPSGVLGRTYSNFVGELIFWDRSFTISGETEWTGRRLGTQKASFFMEYNADKDSLIINITRLRRTVWNDVKDNENITIRFDSNRQLVSCNFSWGINTTWEYRIEGYLNAKNIPDIALKM